MSKWKHGFEKFTKGGHFYAAHVTSKDVSALYWTLSERHFCAAHITLKDISTLYWTLSER